MTQSSWYFQSAEGIPSQKFSCHRLDRNKITCRECYSHGYEKNKKKKIEVFQYGHQHSSYSYISSFGKFRSCPQQMQFKLNFWIIPKPLSLQMCMQNFPKIKVDFHGLEEKLWNNPEIQIKLLYLCVYIISINTCVCIYIIFTGQLKCVI